MSTYWNGSILPGSVEPPPTRSAAIDRRRFVALLTVATAGLAAGGCIPLDRLLSGYRRMLGKNRATEVAILAALVDAVVPGLDTPTLDSPNLTRVFFDPDLPFAPYHLDLSAHLCKLANRRFSDWRFHVLSPTEQREIIAAGLDGGRLVRRLYAGAVFIAQVATYAGIYDDEAGCALIQFEGSSQHLNWANMCYRDAPVLYAADDTHPGGQPA